MKTQIVKASDGVVWCSPIRENRAGERSTSLVPVLTIHKGSASSNPYLSANKAAVDFLLNHISRIGGKDYTTARIGIKSATQIMIQSMKNDEGFRVRVGRYIKGKRTGQVRDAKVTISTDTYNQLCEMGWKDGDRIALSIDSHHKEVIQGVKTLG